MPDSGVVYEALCAIPEIQVERGDVLVLQPEHDPDALLVVKRFTRAGMRVALEQAECLLHVKGAVSARPGLLHVAR